MRFFDMFFTRFLSRSRVDGNFVIIRVFFFFVPQMRGQRLDELRAQIVQPGASDQKNDDRTDRSE